MPHIASALGTLVKLREIVYVIFSSPKAELNITDAKVRHKTIKNMSNKSTDVQGTTPVTQCDEEE